MNIMASQKSFTLVETVLTMLLLLALVLGPTALYPLAMSLLKSEENRFIADNLAYSQLEDLRRVALYSAHNLADVNRGSTANTTLDDGSFPTGFLKAGLKYATDPLTAGTYRQYPGSLGRYIRITVTCKKDSRTLARLVGDVTS